MTDPEKATVAIVDYGLGNLFSIKHACSYTGLQAVITASSQEIWQSDAVILPGVGAFGDAMQALKKLDLVKPLQDVATSGKLLFGICLGMQLLMTESYEFGLHQGLNLIKGKVVKFDTPTDSSDLLKVPQVGWNRIYKKPTTNSNDAWANSPLHGVRNGEYMYFVHSYYVVPESSDLVLTTSRYGNIEFCSSLQNDNIFASQFHPERSGRYGLRIYQNIAALIHDRH